MKTCTKCSIEKPLNEFSKNKSKKDGKNTYCKKCTQQESAQRRLNNPTYAKQWHLNNPNWNTQYNKQYRINNPDCWKSWPSSNPDYRNHYEGCRRKSNPQFKLTQNIRNLIGGSFKRSLEGTYKKSKKTEHILGCTIQEFIEHLQSHFKPGMTLENHGQGEDKWNIDHIIPISSAKTEDEIYKLNHYTNLQPLWWNENIIKGKKIL